MVESRAASPNLLLIVSDDQGAWAWGRASGGAVDTPHLDALAERGTVLERFFCASPVCSPARASLLTGRPPSWHGVHDWLDGAHSGPEAQDYLGDQPLLTDALAEHGYRVGLSGKWHLGRSDVPHPGFAHWFVIDAGGSPYDGSLFHRKTGTGVVSERIEGYLTDTIADDAVEFITEAASRDEPFCSVVTFTAPHSPWTGQHPEEFVAPHRGRQVVGPDGIPVDQEPPHPWLATRDGRSVAVEPDPAEALAGYLGSIAAMDAAIGRIVAAVAELSLLDDTIIIFTSDNGFNTGHHGLWGKGNGTWPFNLYDSSVLVPFIAAGPGVAAQRTSQELVSGYDLAETLCDLTGASAEPFADGPGQSFAGLLTGAPGGRGDVVVHDEYGDARMIRTDEWKYVHRALDGRDELYHLTKDPAERTNLVQNPDHQSVRTELAAQLRDWVARHAHPERRADGLDVSGSGQLAPMVPGPARFNPGKYDQWDR